MKHKARLTISRPTYGCGKRAISIRIRDEDAGIEFVELEIPLDSFAEAITGLSEISCEMEVRALENVGKKIERDRIEFIVPETYSKRKEIAAEEAKKHTPDGWHCSSYFGSQNSFFNRDGKQWARCSITRWVEK